MQIKYTIEIVNMNPLLYFVGASPMMKFPPPKKSKLKNAENIQ